MLLLLFNQGAGGDATFLGQTITATASLIQGAWSTSSGAVFNGQTLTATASLLQGSWEVGATLEGQTVTATASLLSGSWTAEATFEGQTLTATTSLLQGSWSTEAVFPGQTLTAVASLIKGAWSGGSAGTGASAAEIWDYELLPGVTAGAMLTAIYQKTNGLTFTVPGILDANIQYVNDTQVKGTGTDSDPWNPA